MEGTQKLCRWIGQDQETKVQEEARQRPSFQVILRVKVGEGEDANSRMSLGIKTLVGS